MAFYMQKLGFRVWPTATNFVMLRVEGELCAQLAQAYYAKYGKDLPEQAASGKMIFKYYLENSIFHTLSSLHSVLTVSFLLSSARHTMRKN